MKSDLCFVTAISGTIAMPSPDTTAVLRASTVPIGVGSLHADDLCPDSHPMTNG
jgi:hypothetical protein